MSRAHGVSVYLDLSTELQRRAAWVLFLLKKKMAREKEESTLNISLRLKPVNTEAFRQLEKQDLHIQKQWMACLTPPSCGYDNLG